MDDYNDAAFNGLVETLKKLPLPSYHDGIIGEDNILHELNMFGHTFSVYADHATSHDFIVLVPDGEDSLEVAHTLNLLGGCFAMPAGKLVKVKLSSTGKRLAQVVDAQWWETAETCLDDNDLFNELIERHLDSANYAYKCMMFKDPDRAMGYYSVAQVTGQVLARLLTFF